MQKFARQPALILNLWPVYRPRLAPLGVGGWGGWAVLQGLSRPPLALPVASTRGQGADISQKALPGFVDTADLGPGLEQAGSPSQAGGFRVWNLCVWRGMVLRVHPRPTRAGCHCDFLEVPRLTKSRAEAELPVSLGPKRPRARNATLELIIDQGRSGEEAPPQLGGVPGPCRAPGVWERGSRAQGGSPVGTGQSSLTLWDCPITSRTG